MLTAVFHQHLAYIAQSADQLFLTFGVGLLFMMGVQLFCERRIGVWPFITVGVFISIAYFMTFGLMVFDWGMQHHSKGWTSYSGLGSSLLPMCFASLQAVQVSRSLKTLIQTRLPDSQSGSYSIHPPMENEYGSPGNIR